MVNQGAIATPTHLSRALAAEMHDLSYHSYDGYDDLYRRDTENIQGRSVIQHGLELQFSLFAAFSP